MPIVGELKRAKELGKSGRGRYIWLVCGDCGKGRWRQYRKANNASGLCVSCSQKRVVWAKHRKYPSPKGTLDMPVLGDIRWGDELYGKKRRYDMMYMWVACPLCGKEKWVQVHGGVPLGIRCRACAQIGVPHPLRIVRGALAKGTLLEPLEGDVRYGDEIGRASATNKFIWQICKSCHRVIGWVKIRGDYDISVCRLCRHVKDRSPLWKGGRWSQCGYWYVRIGLDSPYASMAHRASSVSSLYVAEHRLVMAESLGRPLVTGEVVHHINHDKSDNRIENLRLMGTYQHLGLTALENKVKKLAETVSGLSKEMEQQKISIRLLLWYIKQNDSLIFP